MDRRLSVAVEDSPHGVEAAASACLFVLAVPHGLTDSLDLSAADMTLGSLSEMQLSDAIGMAAQRSGLN
jgi:beta-phosphoglucomutase-like phosphatase (HAD superfamily)